MSVAVITARVLTGQASNLSILQNVFIVYER